MQTLYINFNAATFSSPISDQPYGLLENASMVVQDGKIAWLGAADDLPTQYYGIETIDLEGRCMTPALIDCHTHIIYGGNRAEEFELRLSGASYEEVARSGGGILSTVKHTRAASEDALLHGAKNRIEQMIAEGVAHIEIKSGYGLDFATELKMLRAAKRVAIEHKIGVSTSLLAAHALPPEFANKSDDYINHICDEILPVAHAEGLIDAVDAFCETIAFTAPQIEKLFFRANALGLPVKIHAEQLTNIGGTKMTAKFVALSADHIEYLDQTGIDAMAKNGMVATLLPAAFYTLRETQKPPIEALRKAGVTIAIATDCNPGSSPITSPLLTMNMACTLFRLTPEEALAGFTINAAKALRLDDKIGSLGVGKIANLAIWDINHPRELAYNIGLNPLFKRVYHSI